MEATCSSERSVDFQQTTGGYIPGDRTIHVCFVAEAPEFCNASAVVIHCKLYTYNFIVSFILVTWRLDRACEGQIDRDFTTSTDFSMRTKYTGARLLDSELPTIEVIRKYNASERL
jgi:hypothetical protein